MQFNGALVEFAGFFAYFFIKSRKFSELRVMNHVQLITLHFPLLKLNLKINSTSLLTRSLSIHILDSQLFI